MATGFMWTNRGKLLIAQGAWDDDASTIIRVGLCKVQGAAADTTGEVADLNTVNDLLVTAGCTEADFTNYARKNLSRTNAAEDDTNDRVNFVCSAITWTAAGGATNNTLYGMFGYDATTDTNDTTRQLMFIDWFASTITTNGGDLTYTPSTDLFRLS